MRDTEHPVLDRDVARQVMIRVARKLHQEALEAGNVGDAERLALIIEKMGGGQVNAGGFPDPLSATRH